MAGTRPEKIVAARAALGEGPAADARVARRKAELVAFGSPVHGFSGGGSGGGRRHCAPVRAPRGRLPSPRHSPAYLSGAYAYRPESSSSRG